jgi:hypothetical protein
MTRLSRGEFWLLGAVVEFPIRLSPLVYAKPDDLEALYNRQYHGLNPDQLLDSLVSLSEHGWIECDRSSAYEVDDSFKPTRDELKSALFAKESDDQDQLAIRLTSTGGDAWDGFVRPKWDRYFGYLEGDGQVEMISQNRSLLESYIKTANKVSFHMIPDSAVWSIQTPAKLLYWKTVPQAHCVTLQIETDAEGHNIMHGPKVWTSHEQFCVDWNREQGVLAFSNWYSWR